MRSTEMRDAMTTPADRPEQRAKGASRNRLSRELIIETALALAERQEASTIRIRDLGRALSVDPSAIYRHFQSKNELMSALVDRLSQETLERALASQPRSWKEKLRAIAEEGLNVYLRYPAIAAEGPSVHTDFTDVVEHILAALEEGGFRGDELVQRYALFSSYVLSFTSSIALTRVLYQGFDPDQPWAQDVRSATAHSHPVANRYRAPILELRDKDVYRVGIEQILAAPPSATATGFTGHRSEPGTQTRARLTSDGDTH